MKTDYHSLTDVLYSRILRARGGAAALAIYEQWHRLYPQGVWPEDEARMRAIVDYWQTLEQPMTAT